MEAVWVRVARLQSAIGQPNKEATEPPLALFLAQLAAAELALHADQFLGGPKCLRRSGLSGLHALAPRMHVNDVCATESRDGTTRDRGNESVACEEPLVSIRTAQRISRETTAAGAGGAVALAGRGIW